MSETERAMADQLDLVIHPFERAIGHRQPCPSQATVEMSPQRTHQLLEGSEPGAQGRVHPAAQMLCGPSRLTVGPEELKDFFEVVGALDGAVPAHQGGEAFALVGGQVPGVLQQQEPRSLERGLLPTAQAAPFPASHFVECPVQVLHQMKASTRTWALGAWCWTALRE